MSADPKAKKPTSPKDPKEAPKSENKEGKAKNGEGTDEDALGDEDGEQTEEQKRAVLDAENLMKQADKRLKSIGFLNKTKFDDALKLFEQAAAQYKLADEYQEAGDVYIKAAELIEEKMKNSDLSPVEYYLKAASCYIGVSTKEALKIYDMAIKLLMDKHNFTYAARIWKDIAELHEKAGNRKACCDAWQKAADCYEAEHQKLHSYQCLLQIARLATVDRDYKRAIKLYEQVSTGIADSDMSKWNITDHLFKAALCQFVIDAKAGEDTKATQAALARYPSLFAQFDNSRESKLIKALCKAYDDDDLKKFTEIVFKHDQVTKFDEWTAQMLLQVKTVLRDGVQSGNDDLASLDADGNLVASGKSEQDKKLEELV